MDYFYNAVLNLLELDSPWSRWHYESILQMFSICVHWKKVWFGTT